MSAYLTVEMWAVKEFAHAGAALLSQALLWDTYVTREEANEHEGYYWLKHTAAQWAIDLENTVPIPTIRKALRALEKAGLLIARLGRDSTPFYRIDHDVYDARRAAARHRPAPYPRASRKESTAGEGVDLSKGGDLPDQGGVIPQIKGVDLPDQGSLSLEKEKEEAKKGSVSACADAHGTLVDAPPSDPLNTTQEEAQEPLEKDKTGKRSHPPAKRAPRALKQALEVTDGTSVWRAYTEAYEKRYGVAPSSNKDTARHAKNLAEAMPIEEAISVAHFYLTVNSAWYVTKAHDIRWAAQDANSLRTQMLTGQRVTQAGARQADLASANMEAARLVCAKLQSGREDW